MQENIFSDEESNNFLETSEIFGSEYDLCAHYVEDSDGKTKEIYSIDSESEIPYELPNGYGFSGGVARNILLRKLGDKVINPRDIDVVAVREFTPDLAEIPELNLLYMPEDSKHGHGISITSMGDYMTSRDFVINEVLAVNGRLYFTSEALSDLKSKIIRPTIFEKDGENGLKPKLALKALRLLAEFEQTYGYGTVSGIEDWQFKIDAFSLFDLAVNLDKAYSRGDDLAYIFYRKLLEKGTIKNSSGSVRRVELAAASPNDLVVSLSCKFYDDYLKASTQNPNAKREDYFLFRNIDLNAPLRPKRIEPDYTEDNWEQLMEGSISLKGIPKRTTHERKSYVRPVDTDVEEVTDIEELAHRLYAFKQYRGKEEDNSYPLMDEHWKEEHVSKGVFCYLK